MKDHSYPWLRQITLKQLRGFKAILDAGSFSGAAKNLHLTPPAVSLQLRDLEATIGIPLVEKSAAGFIPTRGGRAIQELCDKISSLLNEYGEVLHELSGLDHGNASIGVVNPARYFIPNLLVEFKKNYKVQIPGGQTFKPAYYFEFEAGIRYKRDWNKQWSNVFGYGLATREFEAPFTNRNRTAHRFTMQSNHDLFRKVDISFGAAYTAAFTPSGMEFGVTADRSFNNILFKTKLDLDLPKHWDVSAGVKYRIRDYTTNVQADEARYARKNARWSATFEVKKRLWKRGLLVLDVLWMLNQTNKDDDEIDPDIAGYRVFSVGAGIQHKI